MNELKIIVKITSPDGQKMSQLGVKNLEREIRSLTGIYAARFKTEVTSEGPVWEQLSTTNT